MSSAAATCSYRLAYISSTTHERGLLRKLVGYLLLRRHQPHCTHNLPPLLPNVKEFNCWAINGPVLWLSDLIVAIDRAMKARHQLRTVEEIRHGYDTTTRIRIAFLRLVSYLHTSKPTFVDLPASSLKKIANDFAITSLRIFPEPRSQDPTTRAIQLAEVARAAANPVT
ncbi:hypothetical protein VP01_625g7 [Puccinia sorghi]|uniref:Uncharacterized protein n=1 Tax=Puccinia sorghi TaxID=27349 RepID=A0A0L6UH98_9BASI|nr:hypothetical protein VP01_625g7 [Puccinia sorghi]